MQNIFVEKMSKPILTNRLILRQWQEEDLLPFYELNSNPTVMEFFPTLLTREESDALAQKNSIPD